MKKEDQLKLQEGKEDLFQKIKHVISEFGIDPESLSGILFETTTEEDDESNTISESDNDNTLMSAEGVNNALFKISAFHCPKGYKKVTLIDPGPGKEQTFICVPE